MNFDETVRPIHQRVQEFSLLLLSYFISPPPDTSSIESRLERICLLEKKKIVTLYPNLNTQHKYFTQYRNALQSLQIPDPYLRILFSVFKLCSKDADARSLQRDSAIDIKANNVALFDLPPFLHTCKKFLSDQPLDPYTVVIGLMGLTGRRSIEILKTAQFTPHGPHHLLFSGQAKTKNSPHAQHSYIIPVLANPKLIIDSLHKVRSTLPLSHWENEHISSIFSKRLARRVKGLSPYVLPRPPLSLSPRSLRSLYVASAYHLFKVSTKASFNAFAARVLGHSHLDKNTANSYTFYAIRPSSALSRLSTLSLEEILK